MQRYFVSTEQMKDQEVVITGDDARQISKVLRGKAGDQFIVSDGVAREALVEITAIDQGTVTGVIVEELEMTSEAWMKVTVAQSLPKGDKMETVLQKCTEIGAAGFVPFLSARTIVQYDAKKESKRLERWRKIVKEAAEQSHRNVIPEVASPLSWKLLLKEFSSYDAVFFCYEKEQGLQLRDAMKQWMTNSGITVGGGADSSAKVLLIVGPEGGFTEEECTQAEEAGAMSIGLGRRILRCETAGMVALSCIMYESGEMGGI